MLTRRELLGTAIAGSAAFVAGASAAQAFTEQPIAARRGGGIHLGLQQCRHRRSRPVDADRPRPPQGRDRRRVQTGRAEEIVTCPICGCRMVVTASN